MTNQIQPKSSSILSQRQLVVIFGLFLFLTIRTLPQTIKETSEYVYVLWFADLLLVIWTSKLIYSGQFHVKPKSLILFLVAITVSLLLFLQAYYRI